MQKILTFLTRIRCVGGVDGTCHSENQRAPQRDRPILTLMPSFIAFNIYYLGFETPDAKNPHISDEDSLCCEVDGTCYSENQRAPQRDRPTIDTYAIIYRI